MTLKVNKGCFQNAVSIDFSLKGVTVSEAQWSFARDRLKENSDQVNIALQDYRDVQGKFDAIVSIEMFEAVGEQYWQSYFNKIKSALSARAYEPMNMGAMDMAETRRILEINLLGAFHVTEAAFAAIAA